MDIVYKEESYRIMRGLFRGVQGHGKWLPGPVYQECLEVELTAQGIEFVPQAELSLNYKGWRLKQVYIPDFICFKKIILEIKAVARLAPEHRAQVHNYLHATGYKLGILVNFGHYPKVESERIVL